jgi:leucyl-tRNA synthetase
MFDKGLVPKDEYARKLINQGMITGESAFIYRLMFEVDHENTTTSLIGNSFGTQFYFGEAFSEFENPRTFEKKTAISKWQFLKEIIDKAERQIAKEVSRIRFDKVRIDVSILEGTSNQINENSFKNWRPEYKDAIFILDKGEIYDSNTSPEGRPGGAFTVSREVEKMSKSKYNVVSPDAICDQYGADSLRLYEMFLGPLEQSKPWNTAGITGVHGFLKKLWKLYHSPSNSPEGGGLKDSSPSGRLGGDEPTTKQWKILHKTIKKVEEDIESFSFNTSVSTFMICVNELTAQKCTSREILEPLAILVSPYAPHIAEELWQKLGHSKSISKAPFPKFEEKYLVESEKEYPISFNGKMRFTMKLSLALSKEDIEAAVMAHEKTQAQLQGRTPKKVIVVPGKIVNIVG